MYMKHKLTVSTECDIVHAINKFGDLTVNINRGVRVYGKTILVVSAANGGDNMCDKQY